MSIWPVAIVAAMAAIMCHHHPENALRDEQWSHPMLDAVVDIHLSYIYFFFFHVCIASAAPVIIVTHLCALTSMPRSIVSPSEHPKIQFLALFVGNCDDFVEFGRRNTGNRNYRCEFVRTIKADRVQYKRMLKLKLKWRSPVIALKCLWRAICTSTKSNKIWWKRCCVPLARATRTQIAETELINLIHFFLRVWHKIHRTYDERCLEPFLSSAIRILSLGVSGYTAIERTIGLFVSFTQFRRIRIDQQN